MLGCDSLLDLDEMTFGKPASAGGRRRHVAAAVRAGSDAVYRSLPDPGGGGGRRMRAVAGTTVRFGTPSEAEIAAYVASGEPMAMAGVFSIDGLGAPFIEGIDGDPGNVVGLSLPLLRRMLAGIGVPITELWRKPAAAKIRPPASGLPGRLSQAGTAAVACCPWNLACADLAC